MRQSLLIASLNERLGTQFGYTPRMRPPAPSLLRRLAYQENSPLPGPDNDPDGWEILPPIPIRGKAFGVRVIEAMCTVSDTHLPLIHTSRTQLESAHFLYLRASLR